MIRASFPPARNRLAFGVMQDKQTRYRPTRVSYTRYPCFVIDTHCHLTFRDFADRTAQTLEHAHTQGVTGCITIATTVEDALAAQALAKANDRIWCSAGVHPLYADELPEGHSSHDWETLAQLAAYEKCVAWGELGLDNHYDKPPRTIQQRVLEEQLATIEATDARWSEQNLSLKPIILHCRKAFDDLIPRLRASTLDTARFVFHCFTGNPDEIRQCLDFGAMVSFTGVVTYSNAPEVQEAARLVPLDRIMVETDSPFLSPVPKRGKRPCKPGYARYTAEALAGLRDEDWEVFHEAINTNTKRFYGVA